MTEKDLIKIIYNFVKLNPKSNTYPKINKYNWNAFLVVKSFFKNNLRLVNQSNYNEIFSNKDGKFLSGKKWIKILIESKDISDYYINFRRNFKKCNQKKLHKNISDDLALIYYHDEKNATIEVSEINFDINTKTKLEKIRYFLNEKDWSNYFFNLQKLMHEQIIDFLHWKSENLNWKDYSKSLNTKLKRYFNSQQIKEFFEKIEIINLYRNTLSKATIGEGQKHKKLFVNWNNYSIIQKNITAFKLFLNLLDLINTINLIKNKKVI